MNEKRTTSLRDALLKALAVAAFTAVPASALAPIAAQARVLLDDVNDAECDLGNDDTGNGTADNPWRISTVEDLAEITDCNYYSGGGDYYLLTNDLDITPDDNYNNDGFEWNGTDDGWQPIGNYTYELIENGDNDYWDYVQEDFNGHFNGGGHTITGLEIDNWDNADDYIGLFGQTWYSTIENLTIEAAVVDGGDWTDYNDYAGILAGSDYSSTITNVHVSGDITNMEDYVGGLVGGTWGTRISRSSSDGSIQGIDGYTDGEGGLVGRAMTNSSGEETRLTRVSSSMELNDPNYEYDNIDEVGGIVGDGNDWTIINDATFSGSVTGENNIGGIVGYLNGGLVHNVTVDEDALVHVGDSVYADSLGGIVGYMDAGTLSDSVFAGTLDAEQDGDEVHNAGGAVGEAYDTNIVNVTIASTAELSFAGSDSDSGNIGGVVGYAEDSSIGSVVVNTDLTVVDAYQIGGIAGELDNAVVSNSVNRGDVHATLDDVSFELGAVGGLVGYLDDRSEISTSTNKGDVVLDGSEDAWGVGGIAGYGNWSVVVDNYNTGDVTGVYNVAGIVGYIDDTGATTSRNYSVGKLTAYDSDPDGIATVEDAADYTDESNVVLLSDRADNAFEAQEQNVAQLKAATDLADLGWSINVDGSDWATDANLNSGFPYLTWESGTDVIDEPVQLADFTFDSFTIGGGKRFLLNTTEKNKLNAMATTINANPYDEVVINVYYGKKVKLAGKRALRVKRWFLYRGVGTPITVHILPADGSHDVGSVHVSALVNN